MNIHTKNWLKETNAYTLGWIFKRSSYIQNQFELVYIVNDKLYFELRPSLNWDEISILRRQVELITNIGLDCVFNGIIKTEEDLRIIMRLTGINANN